MWDYQQFTPQVKIVKPKFIAAMRFQEREYHGSMPAGRQGGWTSGGFTVQGYRLQDCVYLFIWLDMPAIRRISRSMRDKICITIRLMINLMGGWKFLITCIGVVKKASRYLKVFFLQPLISAFSISDNIFKKRYRSGLQHRIRSVENLEFFWGGLIREFDKIFYLPRYRLGCFFSPGSNLQIYGWRG